MTATAAEIGSCRGCKTPNLAITAGRELYEKIWNRQSSAKRFALHVPQTSSRCARYAESRIFRSKDMKRLDRREFT